MVFELLVDRTAEASYLVVTFDDGDRRAWRMPGDPGSADDAWRAVHVMLFDEESLNVVLADLGAQGAHLPTGKSSYPVLRLRRPSH